MLSAAKNPLGYRRSLRPSPTGFFAALRMTILDTKKPSKTEGLRDAEAPGAAYFFVVTRLNFVVNFSTRPAVSTRRFSPV